MWKKLPDSLWLGIFSGFISLILFYLGFDRLRFLIHGPAQMFQPPRVHLFAIFMNVLMFRFIVVKTDKENFGRGILLATVIVSFIYFYYFFRYHHSLIGS